MKPVEIKGIIPPILTPMNDDESINVAELRNQVDRMIEGGVHALFPFGTNGEGYILNAKEKQLVLETVIEQCNGRVPVYAGTGCISTKETIEQSKMARTSSTLTTRPLQRQLTCLSFSTTSLHVQETLWLRLL